MSSCHSFCSAGHCTWPNQGVKLPLPLTAPPAPTRPPPNDSSCPSLHPETQDLHTLIWAFFWQLAHQLNCWQGLIFEYRLCQCPVSLMCEFGAETGSHVSWTFLLTAPSTAPVLVSVEDFTLSVSVKALLALLALAATLIFTTSHFHRRGSGYLLQSDLPLPSLLLRILSPISSLLSSLWSLRDYLSSRMPIFVSASSGNTSDGVVIHLMRVKEDGSKCKFYAVSPCCSAVSARLPQAWLSVLDSLALYRWLR